MQFTFSCFGVGATGGRPYMMVYMHHTLYFEASGRKGYANDIDPLFQKIKNLICAWTQCFDISG